MIERVAAVPGWTPPMTGLRNAPERAISLSPPISRWLSRCVKAGAEVIAPNGKPFTEQSIGMTLAVRNLMTDLRSSGEVTGGPKSFAPRDRSAFLSALDQPSAASSASARSIAQKQS